MRYKILVVVSVILAATASADILDDRRLDTLNVVERAVQQFYEAEIINITPLDLTAKDLYKKRDYEQPESVLVRTLWALVNDRWRVFSEQLDQSRYDLKDRFGMSKARESYLARVKKYKGKSVTLTKKLYVMHEHKYRYVFVVMAGNDYIDNFVLNKVNSEWVLTDLDMSDSEYQWFYKELRTDEQVVNNPEHGGINSLADEMNVFMPATIAKSNSNQMLPIDEKRLSKAYHNANCDLVFEEGLSAAESGNSRAQLILGLCRMRYGNNKGEGLQWLTRAANNGEPRAARELGVHYMHRSYKREDRKMLNKACEYLLQGEKGGDSLSKNYFRAYDCDNLN
ncbi:MAG: hypothetical protein ABFS08_07895 [Pseudomonadota bacterium]